MSIAVRSIHSQRITLLSHFCRVENAKSDRLLLCNGSGFNYPSVNRILFGGSKCFTKPEFHGIPVFCHNFRNWRTETEEGSSGELWLEFRRFSLLSERLRSIDLHWKRTKEKAVFPFLTGSVGTDESETKWRRPRHLSGAAPFFWHFCLFGLNMVWEAL